jgi:hypothetical protein
MWGDSLSYFITLIFHYMPKTMKNQSVAKHSTNTLTPAGATSVQIIHQIIIPETPTGLIGEKVSNFFGRLKKSLTFAAIQDQGIRHNNSNGNFCARLVAVFKNTRLFKSHVCCLQLLRMVSLVGIERRIAFFIYFIFYTL